MQGAHARPLCYPCRMNNPDDLSSHMPREVLSDLGGWTLYQSFRTFTWQWWIRRGVLVWPLAILASFIYAAWHASGTGAWGDWPGLALRASVASLIAVSAGPLLATIIRHRHLPLKAERVLVVAAILAGLWVSFLGFNHVGAYHAHLMLSSPQSSMTAGLVGRTISDLLRASVDASIFVLIVACGGLAVLYYLGEGRRLTQYIARRHVEGLKAARDAADMRLAVLQAQIEPHFLFNTLASVRSLIGSDPQRAARTVEALADYLRSTLPHFRQAGVEETTLDGQIEICTRYLEIMNVRMAGRIDIRVEAPDAARSLPFPPLILLTLVENAVTHGIEPKPGQRTTIIRALVEGDALIVSVEDDGIGLKPGITPGLGLANVRAQLRNRFGERAALEVKARSEGGTCARIRIPLVET